MNSKQALALVVIIAALGAAIYFTTAAKAPQTAADGQSGMAGMSGMGGMSGMSGMDGMSGMSGMAGPQQAGDCIRYDWNGTAWACTATSTGN